MANQRATRTTEVKGRTITVLTPTDGQMAVLAQHIRIGKRADAPAGAQFNAIGTIMTVLDKLVVEEEDRDFLGGLLVDGDLDIPELVAVVLGGDETLEGETVNATSSTVIKRPTKRR